MISSSLECNDVSSSISKELNLELDLELSRSEDEEADAVVGQKANGDNSPAEMVPAASATDDVAADISTTAAAAGVEPVSGIDDTV